MWLKWRISGRKGVNDWLDEDPERCGAMEESSRN